MSRRREQKTAHAILAHLPSAMQLIQNLERWTVDAYWRRDGTSNLDFHARAELEAAEVALAEYIAKAIADATPVRAEARKDRADRRSLSKLQAAKEKASWRRSVTSATEALTLLRETRLERRQGILGEGFRAGQLAAIQRLLVGLCPLKPCAVPMPSLLDVLERSSESKHIAQHIRECERLTAPKARARRMH